MFRWIVLSCFFSVLLFGVNLKSFFTYTFDANKNYDLQSAKELYFKKKCNTCHGDEAEKKTGSSRVLKDMSADEIKAALIGYTLGNSSSFGASSMAIYAKDLRHEEMDELIAYIKGVNFAIDLQVKDLIEEEPAKKTKHGTFIK